MAQRNWCVTWNNPTEIYRVDPTLLKERISEFDEKECISYAVWQLEQAETGTVHFQMYFELSKPQRFSYIQKVLGAPTAHCEPRKGTALQARAYCMKEDSRLKDPVEYGVISQGQGSRSDLKALIDLAYEGKSVKEAYDACPTTMFRYHKHYTVCREAVSSSVPRVKPIVIVHYGDSGTGKTHDAVSSSEPGQYFIKPVGQWWDGYEGEKVVIMDDEFSVGHKVDYSTILRVLDKYAMQVPVKGGFRNFSPEKIFICSNLHPRDWFPDIVDKKPLFRRISECWHYTGDFDAGTATKVLEELSPTAVPVHPLFNLVPSVPPVAAPRVNGPSLQEEIIEISSDEEENALIPIQEIPTWADLGFPFSEEI